MLLENVSGEVYEEVEVSLMPQTAFATLFQNYCFSFGGKEGKQSEGK